MVVGAVFAVLPYTHSVHPYSQILVTIFSTRPVAILGSGRPQLRHRNTDSFGYPADMSDIPSTQLNTLRPMIIEDAEEAMSNALSSADLATPQALGP